MQAITAAGVIKDALWLTDTFKRVINEVTGNRPERLLGVLQDNTKANRAALVLLEEWCPLLINLGCQAHGLSLLLKDLGKNPSSIVGKTFERANTLVNSVNGSEKFLALVREKQISIYGKVGLATSPEIVRMAALAYIHMLFALFVMCLQSRCMP
jgi:hypothetical protein